MQVQALIDRATTATESFDYHHILMAVDNSAHSNQGVAVGLAIAKVFGSGVSASHAYAAKLHDLRFKQMEGGLPAQYRKEDELEKQRDVHDTLISHGLEIITDSFLDVVDERASELGITLKRKSVEGKNYRALLHDIESSDYDLVVLGALGLGAVRSSTVGSVCERVVRRIDRDVLVIKDPKRHIGDGLIMVAVDGSSEAYAGLKTAILLGKHFNADVEVVSAFDPYFHYVAFSNIANVLSDEAGKVFRFEEQEKLHEEIIDSGLARIYQAHLAVSEKIAAEDDYKVTTKLLAGKPYEVILQHIKKRNPSLLVLGKTGIHADADLDIGHNTENMLRLAPCHLLITNREFTPRAEQIAEETMVWTDEAKQRMNTVPTHVQTMARMAIIRFAQDHGHTVISTGIVDEAVENLLPADAMQAMGMIAQAAKKREAKKAAKAAEEADMEDGAERTFDQRVVIWGKGAKQALDKIDDETTREHVKLRTEKLAHHEQYIKINAKLVYRVMGEDDVPEANEAEESNKLIWSEAALQRIERVPEGFMRDASRSRVEDYARGEGCVDITLECCETGLAEARKAMMGAMSGDGMAAMMERTPHATAREAGKDETIAWTDEATERMKGVPEGFMRELTCQRIESFAKRTGVSRVDNKLIDAKYAEWGEGSAKQHRELEWEEEAWARVQRIPDFVRGMVIKEVERYAREAAADTVGLDALNKASGAWEKGDAFHSL